MVLGNIKGQIKLSHTAENEGALPIEKTSRRLYLQYQMMKMRSS